jgi:hypothetical protein
VAIALDGDRVAIAAGNRVDGIDAVTGDLLFTYSGSGTALEFAGQHLLVAWRNVLGQALLNLVDWSTGQVERTLSPAENAEAISVDGGIALIGIAQRSLAQTVNCDTGQFLQQFRSPTSVAGGNFGGAVIQFAGSIAVGAPGEAGGDGRVHLLDETDGSLQRTIAPPTAGESGSFGFALTALGATLLIAAPGDGSGEGRVYVYNPDSDSLVRTFSSPDPLVGGEFGFAIAASGGVVAIGAPGEGGTSGAPGAVHLFDDVGNLNQTIPNPAQTPFGRFGAALAADSVQVLVGAPGNNNSTGSPSGQAYLIDFGMGNTTRVSALPDSPSPTSDGRFGAAVAIAPSYFLVGAPGEDANSIAQPGRLHSYARGTEEYEESFDSTNAVALGGFASSLSVSGNRVAIGAPGEPAIAEGSLQFDPIPQLPNAQTLAGQGVVHVGDLTTGFRDQRYENQQLSAEPGRFGQAVYLTVDSLLVGAPDESKTEGRAYRFDLDRRRAVISPNVEDNGGFGFSCATFDSTQLIVGAIEEDQANGRVYLYDAELDSFPLTIDSPSRTNEQFGASVAGWNGWIAAGAPAANAGAGAVYVFDSQGNDLDLGLASPGQGGRFGESLAVDAAGNLVVGEPEANGAVGLVHIFDNSGSLVRTLDSGQTAEEFEFGFRVFAIGNDIAVHAAMDGISAGRVFVFDSNGALRYTLNSPGQEVDTLFGFGVALYNGEIHVGEPGGQTFGAVHVYRQSDGAYLRSIASPLSQETLGFGLALQPHDGYLAVSAFGANGGRVAILDDQEELVDLIYSGNPKNPGGFGFCMAEVNGELAIGSPLEDVNPIQAGRVYLTQVSINQSEPPLTGADQVFTSPSPAATGAFGISVAFSGANSVIGAPNEDGTEGAAHVMSNATGAIDRTIRSPNAASGGAFGAAVAGNALMTVIGAPGEMDGQDRVGRAYLFDAATGSLGLTFDSGHAKDGGQFGFSVAVADLNLVVGAPGEDVGTFGGAGRAYYFDCQVESILTEFQSPNPTTDGEFGRAVAARDFEVFIGAPGESNGAGRVYWFNGLTGALLGTFTSPNAMQDGAFGLSLAVEGDRLVVGAPNEITPQGDEFERGRVHVFNLATSSLERSLSSPNGQDGGRFGVGVAIAGGSIYVGAPGELNGSGSVWEFDATNGSSIDGYVSPNQEFDGAFGGSVAGTGANLLVGAPFEDGGAVDSGRAYLNPEPGVPQ